KKLKAADSFAIKFKRKSTGMQMPIDFTIEDKKGNKHNFHIPNNWFEKDTDALILPRWIGWGKLNQQYNATVYIPDGIRKVTIDTTYLLADRYMLNNTRKKGAIINKDTLQVKLDGGVYGVPEWKKYKLYIRPDLWYN